MAAKKAPTGRKTRQPPRASPSRTLARPHPPFDALRATLGTLQPTGERGFEGLIASACAQLAGVPFRLVGSGRQFGRDAEGLSAGSTIMMEAKRYKQKLSFDALSVKLIDALQRSRREVEVWCAAATVAFEATDAEDLRTLGEERGTTVLVLDWALPIPPLAVLLASAGEAVADWFARNAAASVALVEIELASVRSHSLYRAQADALRAEFHTPTFGLALARRRNSEWLRRHFSDVGAALLRFNQALAPLDASVRPALLERVRLEARIRDAIGTWRPEPGVVVLTGTLDRSPDGRGDEGVGKSWAAARAWLGLPDGAESRRPLLLFMTSHMWREGDDRAPMVLVARLLAEQTGSAATTDPARWQVRLERWLAVAEGSPARPPAIVLVLDGVNERTNHPWPQLIRSLAVEARTRLLRIVVTTRRGIYERDLARRLEPLDVQEIAVEPFSDEELDHLLELEGRSPATVRDPLRRFLRNPRVLSVGLDLLDRLDPDEVGIERLLFEYLRKRQQERAGGGGHTPEQLAQVLVRHAREIRERLLERQGARQSVEFDDRTIGGRLGLPADQANLALDLGDIIDSGFIRIVDPRRNRYALREHGKALGLGLLVVEELDDAIRSGATELHHALDAIVEPIRAIDETALVLLGALDVAIADPYVDNAVSEVLLHQLLTLQNVPPGQRARLFSGLNERPDVFISVADRLFGERNGAGRREWMRDALVAPADGARTADAVDRAVRRWLRSWQPEPSPPDLRDYPEEQATSARRHHEETARRHRDDLATLTDRERAFVDRELVPLPIGYEHRVDELAIAILSGRALLSYADALFAWCVAAAAGWDAGGMREAMDWLRRLAPLDWEASARAVGDRAATFLTPDRSRIFQWAVEYALAGSGDHDQARRASEVWLLPEEESRPRWLANPHDLPDVDPLDPDAVAPELGMEDLASRYRGWTVPREDGPPAVLMRHFDSPASRLRLFLCRFDTETAAGIHRDLAARSSTFERVSPTVIAQFLQHDMAILAPVADPIVDWIENLRSRSDLEIEELEAPTRLLAAVLPHLDAERQFEVHAGQRADTDDAFWLGVMFKPLPERAVEDRLRSAASSNEPLPLRLALVATAEAGSAAVCVRAHALDALESYDTRLRATAIRAMTRVGDERDDQAFAESWRRRLPIVGRAELREDFWGSVRFERATRGIDEPGRLNRLHPALRSLALEGGGPRMLEVAVDRLVGVLRETDPGDLVPKGLEIDTVRSDDLPSDDDPMGSWHRIGFRSLDEEFEAPDGTRRRTRTMSDFFALSQMLDAAGQAVLLYPFSSAVLDHCASQTPDAFGRLAHLVEELAGTEKAVLAAVLAFDVARVLSHADPMRAAALMASYESVEPLIPETMPTSGLPRRSLLLWRSADSPGIAAMRHRRLDACSDDLEISREILAAEMAGRHRLVVDYVGERLSSRHPADLARAITAAGFASEDETLEAVFADPRFGRGFLGTAARKARRSYDLARWAAHWHRAALAARDGVGLWRSLELATACVDGRCTLWLDQERGGALYECQRATTAGRYANGIDSRDQDRRKTLFGWSRPPAWMDLRRGLAPAREN